MDVGAGLASNHRARRADALALLGDNFYPIGLEVHELVERVRENVVRPLCIFTRLDGPRSAEVSDACPLRAAGRDPVPIHVMLGNHDHMAEGSPHRQREDVPRFVPNWSVADRPVHTVETGRGVSLVLLDSLMLWTEPKRHTDAFRDALQASRGPWRVIVAHHPPLLLEEETDAEREWHEAGLRSVRGALADAGVLVHVWLAGHEHSLQLVPGRRGEPAVTVIAGTGSEPRSPDVRPGTLYASDEPGFARIDLVGTSAGDRLAVTLYGVGEARDREHPQARARVWVDSQGGLTQDTLGARAMRTLQTVSAQVRQAVSSY